MAGVSVSDTEDGAVTTGIQIEPVHLSQLS